MDWPSTLADGDVVIVRDETTNGSRYVVHGRCGPQLACRTYAEAEARSLSYAEQSRARVWYADARGLQLVGHHVRAASSPIVRQAAMTPGSKEPGIGEKA